MARTSKRPRGTPACRVSCQFKQFADRINTDLDDVERLVIEKFILSQLGPGLRVRNAIEIVFDERLKHYRSNPESSTCGKRIDRHVEAQDRAMKVLWYRKEFSESHVP